MSCIIACIPRARCLAVMLCFSTCDASSLTFDMSISGRLPGCGAAMAASSSELASDGHAFFFFFGFSADGVKSVSFLAILVGESSGGSVCDAAMAASVEFTCSVFVDGVILASSSSIVLMGWYSRSAN
mgnify:CR=1 FL=1|jgi:hypothetical protein